KSFRNCWMMSFSNGSFSSFISNKRRLRIIVLKRLSTGYLGLHEVLAKPQRSSAQSFKYDDP
ncbi:MAG: hypothetical protein RIA69_06310, partial [Cyclobacteriaceae bacterium]